MTLADTQAIAHLTGRKPATIRSWAHRGKLKRQGTNGAGRALYDIEQAQQIGEDHDSQRTLRIDGQRVQPTRHA